METLKVFLITVVVFGVLIFVHELGHFIAARIFGVRINEFAIGMGPKIFSYKGKKSGTLYSLRLLPIGGYNSMEGEDGETGGEEISEDSFCCKPVWQRMIIIVAGAFMNILLGFIIMSVIVLNTKQYASNVIDVFVKTEGMTEYPTEYGELKSGDRIIKINGDRVHIADEVSYAIFNEGATPVNVTVIRDGKKMVIENVQFPTSETEGVVYGVRNFYFKVEPKNFVNTVKHTFYGSINSMVQIFDSLKGIASGKYGIEGVSGPIGVGEALGEAAKISYSALLTFVVLLAMNLGIFNLLPIPALDGGRLVFLIVEAIRRKPLPKDVEATVNGIGMILLLGLVAVVAFKDVFMIFGR